MKQIALIALSSRSKGTSSVVKPAIIKLTQLLMQLLASIFHRSHQNFGKQYMLKGQIISECPYEIILSPIRPTKIFPRFRPLLLRRGQIKKIKTLYYTNQGLFNIFGLIKFFIQPLFQRLGQKSLKKIRWFFGRNDDTQETF